MSEVKKIEAYLVMWFSRWWMVKRPRRNKTLRKQKATENGLLHDFSQTL